METNLANLEEGLRRATTWSMVAAVGAIVVGLIALAAPLAGALAEVMIFGVSSMLSGALELGYAWRLRRDRGTVWRFVIGIVQVAVGAWVLIAPTVGIVALALWLGAMIVTRGVMQLLLAYELRKTRVWGWFVVDGLIGVLLGAFVLAAWPQGSILLLGIWFGASLIWNGVMRFIVASGVRRSLPPQQKAPPLSAAPA